MNEVNKSMSLTVPSAGLEVWEKIGAALAGMGLLSLVIAAFGAGDLMPHLFLIAGFGLIFVGATIFFIRKYAFKPEGIKNDHSVTRNLTSQGIWAWLLAVVLTGFYILLYWFPQTLVHLTTITDPLSFVIRGKAADHWFLYATFYTLAILVMGFGFILKYRHSRYHIIRTISVMAVQLLLAFLLPYIMEAFNQQAFFFTYFWPLDYDSIFPSSIENFSYQQAGQFIIFWLFVISFIAVPVFTYFWGKRWYCSWVCGCGGLAETAGDPFRHLSQKSLLAWQIERWMVHGVLLLITFVTIVLWLDWRFDIWDDIISQRMSEWYGFFIGAVFAGVIGVGFYPLMGSRVWCRYGCPQAAILGLLQKYFSRFRISTNGGQCISCGNCSTYCEMGIDVMWYAQRGQDVIRASCVGCGICSSVCPRGVLNLESGPIRDKAVIHIKRDEVKLL